MRGDALFGKRTFLVRHGRRATCRLSATFLVVGVSVLPFVRQLSVALVAAYAVYLVITLGLLRALARSTSARRDSALIAAIAIFGRGMLVTLYADFAMLAAHWSLAAASALIGALTVVVTGMAFDVLRTGEITDTFVPPAFAAGGVRKTIRSPRSAERRRDLVERVGRFPLEEVTGVRDEQRSGAVDARGGGLPRERRQHDVIVGSVQHERRHGVRSNRRGTSSIGRRPVVCSYTHQLAWSFCASAYGSVWNATSSGVNAFGVPQRRWPYMPGDVAFVAARACRARRADLRDRWPGARSSRPGRDVRVRRRAGGPRPRTPRRAAAARC